MALKGNHSFPVFHSDLYSVDKSGWMALDLIWTKVTGYNTQQFEFTSGSTPIATFKETSSLLVLYYVTILGGREIMRSFPAFKLQKATLIHNFALSFLSAVLLFLFLEQLLPNLWARGTYYCVCEQGGWSKELETLYYVRLFPVKSCTTPNNAKCS
jgi:fatty acid elongase 3